MDSLIEELRCFVCHQYLVYGPLRETLDGNIICGKCFGEMPDARRTHYLERLLKKFSFPCKNVENGCKFQLSFGVAGDHENTCKYERIPCPYSTSEKCVWKDTVDDRSSHN